MSNCDKLVGIVGLGYVGMPLARLFVKAGYRVRAVDTNAARRDELKKLSDRVSDGGEYPSKALGECPSVWVICLPTPVDAGNNPDLQAVRSAAESIHRLCRWTEDETLVILESTVGPGTTKELSQTGPKNAIWVHSPERINPGTHDSPDKIPKLVGGVTEYGTCWASSLYESIGIKVHPVSSAEIAECAKVFENTFRFVNIALANEFKKTLDALELPAAEVFAAAATKPFGFMPFRYSIGVGGHCIPVDPWYLQKSARFSGAPMNFIDLASSVNSSMPRYTAMRLMQHPFVRNKPNAKKVLILGAAYKPDSADARHSPTFELKCELEKYGFQIRVYDPLVYAEQTTVEFELWFYDSSIILLCVPHSMFDATTLAAKAESVGQLFLKVEEI